MTQTQFFSVGLFVTATWVFFLSIKKSKRRSFYTDTPWLFPLGVFVWGDGLILAPFWMGVSVLFFFLPPLHIIRFFCLFFAVRSAYEVVYWINHQVVAKDYNPPLFRRISWLKPNESAILYQLLNMCQVILALTFLGLSFLE